MSAPTAQAAVHVLVALGFLRVSRGNGTYVRSLPGDSASLTHAVLHASPIELAAMRAAIDERAAILAAAALARSPRERVPMTLHDINFLAGERSTRRSSFADTYIRADLESHAAIIRSMRGMEVAHDVYLAIGRRVERVILPSAEMLATDDTLDAPHRSLAAAVLDGNATTAARFASAIARREHGSIEAATE